MLKPPKTAESVDSHRIGQAFRIGGPLARHVAAGGSIYPVRVAYVSLALLWAAGLLFNRHEASELFALRMEEMSSGRALYTLFTYGWFFEEEAVLVVRSFWLLGWGHLAEKHLGSRRYIVIVLAGLLGGTVAAWLTKPGPLLGAGAWTAGVIGGGVTMVLVSARSHGSSQQRWVLSGILIAMVLMPALAILALEDGLSSEHAAAVGGLAGGALCSFALLRNGLPMTGQGALRPPRPSMLSRLGDVIASRPVLGIFIGASAATALLMLMAQLLHHHR